MTLRLVAAAMATAAVLTAAAPRSGQVDQRTFLTPFVDCGEDESLAGPIPESREAIVLAADGRLFSPCALGPTPAAEPPPHDARHREVRERALLDRAAHSTLTESRRLTAQAYGRMGADAVPFADVYRLLGDTVATVRLAAAVAIGGLLSGPMPDPVSGHAIALERGARPAASAAQVERWLEERLRIEPDEQVAGAILETLGRLPYELDEDRNRVEQILASALMRAGEPHRLLGAVKGLEALIRRSPRRPVAESTRARLRETALHRSRTVRLTAGVEAAGTDDLAIFARARRVAMLALGAARDEDEATVRDAYRDLDWQVRRLAVLRMNAALAEFTDPLDEAQRDPAFQVRYEAVRAAGAEAARTKTCGPILRALDDSATVVVLQALDALPAGCGEQATIVPRVAAMAAALAGPLPDGRWHVPARALTALARIAPDTARPLLSVASAHAIRQVRAAAADAAATLGDQTVALSLTRDAEPTVQIAALRALSRLSSPAVHAAALRAVAAGTHYDAIRTGADLLRGTTARDEARETLLRQLRRLTDEAWDTSRDPRVAIVNRLGEVLTAADISVIAPWVHDFDPRVSRAVRDVMRKLAPGSDPPWPRPRQRYPYQPTVEQLRALPASATIQIEGLGPIVLEFLPDVAPVTIARFAELARLRYYDGLTFHRVVPNFVVQGGSPGANEYAGVSRYLRDEPGAPNLRGTVGISTRGRDTGDAQIFINLVDSPRLDHDYTVFARVTSGLDVVDRILEGARIVAVTVR